MIKESKLIIEGSPIEGESPLPILRDIEAHRKFEVHENMPKHLKDSLGHYCGYRVLPYKLQNHYSRDKETLSLKTIVLENELIKATFLPEYGGRLYSLFNKVSNKELLSVNPVFQPANLALRNAWFSGGIEWNMAHFGHSYLSCDHVHFASCQTEDGEEFLRLYEYERTKKLYYQIDFYLPKAADYLVTYTKIFNINETATPLYYWSNTAVSELNRARVFSSTDQVIYIKPYSNEKGEMVNTFAYGKVPTLEGIEGDVSYPRNFDRSNEYFYQTDSKVKYPWEAVGYDDGSVFFECSTDVLRYRKMFCWGKHKGGTKWQEYLSQPEQDKYVEIQAGVFPSQLHSETLSGEKSLEFMQVFGGLKTEAVSKLYEGLSASSQYVETLIFDKINQSQLQQLEQSMAKNADLVLDKILHRGHGWGYIEQQRLQKEGLSFPIKSMRFDEESLSDGQTFYLELLSGNLTRPYDLKHVSLPYMIDLAWEKYLLKIDDDRHTENIALTCALMYSENQQVDQAIQLMENHMHASFSSLYDRTLAVLYNKTNDNKQAFKYYQQAYEKRSLMTAKYYQEDFLHEYLSFLFDHQAYEKAWTIYKDIEGQLTEELLLDGAKIAFELKQYEMVKSVFEIELSRIREGDNTLVELWFKMKAVELNTDDIDYVRKSFTPPSHIDFRMV